MRVWNIKVTDRRGSDGYSFIQEHTPTERQLNQIKQIYQNSGRYLKEELELYYFYKKCRRAFKKKMHL